MLFLYNHTAKRSPHSYVQHLYSNKPDTSTSTATTLSATASGGYRHLPIPNPSLLPSIQPPFLQKFFKKGMPITASTRFCPEPFCRRTSIHGDCRTETPEVLSNTIISAFFNVEHFFTKISPATPHTDRHLNYFGLGKFGQTVFSLRKRNTEYLRKASLGVTLKSLLHVLDHWLQPRDAIFVDS